MSRRFAKTWVLACLMLSAGLVALDVAAWPEPRPVRAAVSADATGTAARTEEERAVRAISVVGTVEVRSGGGPWRPLRRGDLLRNGDRIRSQDFSEVVLRDAAGSTVAVTPNTEFTIGEKTPDVSRFTLGEGRVAADIRGQKTRTYEFESAVGDAKADTKEGRFSITADGRGLFGVVTREGEVGLEAKGRRVVVPAGKQAFALPGKAPGDPLPIPEQVLLQVRWPRKNTAKSKAVVQGVTDPGARVKLGSQRVEVAPDGRFEVTVPLAEGENRFVRVAEDPAGNTRAEKSPLIVRDTSRPRLRIQAGDDIWE